MAPDTGKETALSRGTVTSPCSLKDRIAVSGATGYVGGRLVPRLLMDGRRIRCLTRSAQKLASRNWSASPLAEICEVDFGNERALAASLEGCEAAYYLVHSMAAAGGDFRKRDLDLAKTFAAACRIAGVKRIIYLGGLGETGEELSEHLASRREVEHELCSGGTPVTVLRAAMIIGSGSASFEILRYLVERLPVMITPRWVQTRCQPIAIRNVLGYLAGCLEHPETTGRTFDIGGPDIVTYAEMIGIMAEERKLPRRIIIPIPILSPGLSSRWINLITPIDHKIARPLAEGLKNPVVCGDDNIRKIVPQILLTVRQAIHAALANVLERHVETSWSMAGAVAGDPDWAGGKLFTDERTMQIDAPPHAVFRAVCRIGGRNGWYSSSLLWRLRGMIDRIAGGPGLRRGRRDSELIYYGEAIDFWRVTGYETDRRLALFAEMKLPGEASLEFLIKPEAGERAVLTQTARFQPHGLAGLLYWYGVLPLHHYVFRAMISGIAAQAKKDQAEKADAQSGAGPASGSDTAAFFED